jgi:outer membrane protein assembly factor BamD (BamD/ComL family)
LTRLILVVIIGAIAGCSTLSLPLPSRPSSTLLAQADRLLGEGQYTDALEVYGEVVTKYPNTDDAARARARHDTIAGLLAARAQVTRLTGEVTRLTAETKAQEAELVRTREQVAGRDGELARARQEIGRLTAETDRLRTDLEHLKKIDIDLERRRK